MYSTIRSRKNHREDDIAYRVLKTYCWKHDKWNEEFIMAKNLPFVNIFTPQSSNKQAWLWCCFQRYSESEVTGRPLLCCLIPTLILHITFIDLCNKILNLQDWQISWLFLWFIYLLTKGKDKYLVHIHVL